MEDENNEKSKEEKKFAGLGGEPDEDEQPTPTETSGDADELNLYDLDSLEIIIVDGHKMWVDGDHKVLAFKTKDPKSGVAVVAHAIDDEYHLAQEDGSDPYIADKANQSLPKLTEKYQLAVNNFYADKKAAEEAAKKAAEPKPEPKPVPPTEAPKPEDAFEEVTEEEPKDSLETKVATAAPTPAKGMEYKFVDGFWSAYVAVYDGGKKIGEYSAFGGKVTGPNANKLGEPVLERIKEEYFKGMKGK